MLTTFPSLGLIGSPNEIAIRNPLKMRRIPVRDNTIKLRDYASCYSIDLSASGDGASYSYSLDTTQTHEGNHEVLGFEVALTLPAVGAVSVSFSFVETWMDFCGLWRLVPGQTYFISFFRIGGKWIGSVNGEKRITSVHNILSRSSVQDSMAIALQDDRNTYEYTVTDSGSFSFNTSGLSNGKSVLCFDLLLNIEAETPSLTFPVSCWFDFCMPARGFKHGEKHAMTFISLDAGTNWIGRWNNYL